MNAKNTIWVVGATGLVGRAVVAELARDANVERVVAVVRRPLEDAGIVVESKVVPFDELESRLTAGPVDVAICCLGTTIKQAGSQAAFRKVDHDYVLSFARAAKRAGAKRFIVVTALGANPRSLTFYNRVKGEVEAELATLGFEALTIVRPSLLLGDRSETRIGERLAAPFSRFLPQSIRGIEGTTVARAIVRLTHDTGHGRRLVPSAELQILGA